MTPCTAPPTGSGFLAATLGHLDCQAQNIGESGYQALASAGSPLALATTGLLAVFIAVIGFRFLTGKPLGVDEWIGAALKLGFVLALTASWPAYKTVVYDLILKGPAEISGSIGRASALPGGDGGLATRLQGVDGGIMTLVEAGSGRNDISSRAQQGEIAPPLADDTTLGWGKALFVASIIGSFGLLRLTGGLLLALAPLFAGFLLFEATRFLFFGWLRSLIAIALGSIGIAIVLGVQLAIMEPWLSQVLALRAAQVATLAAPFELLALALSFAVAMFGVLALAARIGFAADVVTRVQAVINRTAEVLPDQASAWSSRASANDNMSSETSRAQVIAQSMNQVIRRDGDKANATGNAQSSRAPLTTNATAAQNEASYTPLGRTYPSPSRRVGSNALNRRLAT